MQRNSQTGSKTARRNDHLTRLVDEIWGLYQGEQGRAELTEAEAQVFLRELFREDPLFLGDKSIAFFLNEIRGGKSGGGMSKEALRRAIETALLN